MTLPDPDMLGMIRALSLKILPLYAIMGLGFLLGRSRPQAGDVISFLQIYMVAPFVVASFISSLDFSLRLIIYPLPVLIVCCCVAYGFLYMARPLIGDRLAHVFSLGTASANTGYFGLPIAFILFPENAVGHYILMITGMTIFESTLGYYLLMRGAYTWRESMDRLVKFPLLYGVIVGIALSACGFSIPQIATDTVRDFRGAYVVFGALIIGIGLARLQHFRFDGRLLLTVFGGKFLLWPLLALLMIVLDRTLLHWMLPEQHTMLVLVSVMPLPANLIAYTFQHNVEPDKASTLTFLSTVFALFYVPAVMALWPHFAAMP